MEFNLSQVVRAVAEAVPDREAIVHRGGRLTFGRLLERVDRLAAVLGEAGLGAHRERAELAPWESGQDHLALYLHNGPEYLEGMFGAYAARVAPFNVNYRYVAEELRYLLTDSKAPRRSSTTRRSRRCWPRSAPSCRTCSCCSRCPTTAASACCPTPVGTTTPSARVHAAPPAAEPSPDDLYILYTGGTTGMPKGVLWRQADIYPAALGGRQLATGEEWPDLAAIVENARNGGTRVLPAAPFMHGAAHWLAINSLGQGNTIVLPGEHHHVRPRRRVGHRRARVGEHRAHRRRRLRAPAARRARPGHLRPLLARAAHQRRRRALGPGEGGPARPHPGHGDHGRPRRLRDRHPGQPDHRRRRTGEHRHVHPRARAWRSSSEDLTHLLEPGTEELGWLAQTGRVPLGYLGDEAKTARTFPTIGGVRYSVPGDRARVTADGLLELHGRDSVTINSGGEKIFAEEVEAALAHHPAVYDVVVTGRPSERWGQEVVAVVQLREGFTAAPDDLLAECEHHIARYKLPKAIVFVDRVVRSPAGKADYRWAKRTAEDAGATAG